MLPVIRLCPIRAIFTRTDSKRRTVLAQFWMRKHTRNHPSWWISLFVNHLAEKQHPHCHFRPYYIDHGHTSSVWPYWVALLRARWRRWNYRGYMVGIDSTQIRHKALVCDTRGKNQSQRVAQRWPSSPSSDNGSKFWNSTLSHKVLPWFQTWRSRRVTLWTRRRLV